MKDCLDEKLAVALYDLPVPEGLGDRLLQRLRSEELGTTRAKGSVVRSSLFVLRWSLLAMAAGLLIAVWLGGPRSADFSPQFVLDEAIRSFESAADEPGALVAEKPAPIGYPISVAVLQVRGTRWRPLAALVGYRGVVYDLPGRGGVGASLYVIRADGLEGFDRTPTLSPYATAGCCASSWQEGGLLYVLVVQGDTTTYRAYLNLPQGPLA